MEIEMYFLFGFFVTLAFISAPTSDLFPVAWPVVTIVIAIIAGTGLHVVVNGNSFNLNLNRKEKEPKTSVDLASPTREQANRVAVGLVFVLLALFVFTALLSL